MFNCPDASFNSSAPVKLVGTLLLVINSKLDSSDKLKTVLLIGYKGARGLAAPPIPTGLYMGRAARGGPAHKTTP